MIALPYSNHFDSNFFFNGMIALFFYGWLIMVAIMAALWLYQKRLGDAGIVDVAWSYGIGVLALFYLIFLPEIPIERRLLVCGVAVLWSARLGTYLLFNRVIGKHEDGRYKELRRSWGDQFQRKLFWFYQAQGAADSLLTIPFLIALAVPASGITIFDIVGAFIVVLSVSGETLADSQLAAFRADPSNKGKTCRKGLWRFSRHPNYFFEWLHWMAYPIMALPLIAAGGMAFWLASFSSAVVILWLVLKVTGIPPTEAQALRSRGEDYRRYQRETSAFFPWFPKKLKES